MADSDPKLSPHNVESAGFASGSVKGQYDVSAPSTKKLLQTQILVNLHSLLVKIHKKSFKDLEVIQKGLFCV